MTMCSHWFDAPLVFPPRSCVQSMRPRSLAPTTPTPLATHEAAHALLAVANQVPVAVVVIGRDHPNLPGCAGYCEYRKGAMASVSAWSLVVTAVAGAVAEQHFLGRSPPPDSEDHGEALRNAHRLTDVNVRDVGTIIQALAEARACALQIIKENSTALTRLALELDRCRELQGAEVERILGVVSAAPTREEFLRAIERRNHRIIEILEARERKNAVGHVAAAHGSTPPDRAIFVRTADG